MKIDVLTLFPQMLLPLRSSMVGRALEKGILDINAVDIREHTLDKHRRVDDYPFGGGAGMLMQAEPIFRAIESVNAMGSKILYMSPKGKILNGDKLRELSKEEHLIILCGHYEGIDQRVMEFWDIEEVSIGDYILTGGEPAAIVLIDALSRMIPNVLGKEVCIMEESIYSGLLEAPQYTKPREYKGLVVPDVLISGHHKNIELWKYENALLETKKNRKDLFDEYCKKEHNLSKEEKLILEKVKEADN